MSFRLLPSADNRMKAGMVTMIFFSVALAVFAFREAVSLRKGILEISEELYPALSISSRLQSEIITLSGWEKMSSDESYYASSFALTEAKERYGNVIGLSEKLLAESVGKEGDEKLRTIGRLSANSIKRCSVFPGANADKKEEMLVGQLYDEQVLQEAAAKLVDPMLARVNAGVAAT